MFLSFGGLDSNGGYNIRVARATRPDGPYYDAEGNDMINVKADPTKPLFDDRSIEPYGVKLMGNFLFERKSGDPGTGIGTGYVSPGHNSAYYDPATGQQFLIFHTRFPQQGEMHQIRVHQLFMNQDGCRWLRRTVMPAKRPTSSSVKTLSASTSISTTAKRFRQPSKFPVHPTPAGWHDHWRGQRHLGTSGP